MNDYPYPDEAKNDWPQVDVRKMIELHEQNENNMKKFEELLKDFQEYIEKEFGKMSIEQYIEVSNKILNLYNSGIDKATKNAIEIINKK